LKIYQENDQDWDKLIEQCDIGFIYKNNNIQLAESQAFTIDVTKIKPKSPQIGSEIVELKFQQLFDSTFKEHLILNGEITATLPYLSYLSLLVGITVDQANEFSKSRSETTVYSCDIIRKSKLNLDRTNINLKPAFINEVRSALKYASHMEKIIIIENNKDVNTQEKSSGSAKIVSSPSVEGGYAIENTTLKLLNISERKLTIVGGKSNWKIVSYSIRPIFELLNDDLKNKVLEVFGKQILKAGIISHYTTIKKPCMEPIVIDNLCNEIKDVTSNPLQCQIFASVMNQDNRIYSLRVEYLDENTPTFVIHYVGEQKPRSKERYKKEKYKIQVGWIVVGYPEKFVFEQSNCEIEVNENECKVNEIEEKSNLSYSYPISSSLINSLSNHSKLGISLIEVPKNARCGLLKVKWEENKNMNIFSCSAICKKLIACGEDRKSFESIFKNLCVKLTNEQEKYRFCYPLLINIINDCNHHGFLNITPKCPLYHSLNLTNSENLNFEGQISY
ncbi:6023_t:CDS:2, partial [Gigaspora margarita]